METQERAIKTHSCPVANGRKPGRPPKYTADLIEAIALAVQRGLSIREAAAIMHVTDGSITTWMHRADFADRIARAKATYIDDLLGNIARAGLEKNKWGQTQWQAHAWLLERGFPERFALRPASSMAQGITLNLTLADGRKFAISAAPQTQAITARASSGATTSSKVADADAIPGDK